MQAETQLPINKIILFIGFNIILLVILYNIPIEINNFNLCIYKAITGKDCFNCGMTRAFLSVLHLNFIGAFEYNSNVIFVFPITIIVYLYSWYRFIIRKEIDYERKD